jgi:hypothetical protein
VIAATEAAIATAGKVGETLLETRPTSLGGLSALNHGLKLVRPIDATAH